MNSRSLSARLILAQWLVLAAPCLFAQDGLECGLRQARFATVFGPKLAIADFDNDQKADGALLIDQARSRSVRIELHLSDRTTTEFVFESNETHTVTALDVDADGDMDVVVERAFSLERVHVWLNDGGGKFTSGSIADYPRASRVAHEQLRAPARRIDPQSLSLPAPRRSEPVM